MKYGAIGKASLCNEIAQNRPSQFSFLLFGEYSMMAYTRIVNPWSPARVLRLWGFPVVKSRLWELGNLTHSSLACSRVPNREYIGKGRLKGS
jgi:hypothetical protein